MRWIFLRALGVVYFIAFCSLSVQVLGLVGKEGILPVADFLQSAKIQTGGDAYHWFPTLCWLSAGDGFLKFLCWGGAGLSLLLVFNVAPAAVLSLLCLFYLSLSVAGQEFLSFQWDVLLIETGFLAIFYAPWKWRPGLGRDDPPSPLSSLALNWLLFRLMLSSGLVKLLSGDRAWRDLTALTFHFETQPLPVWTSWYAQQLPLWFHKASTLVMYSIELAVPFFIFGGRKMRYFAAAATAGFMVLIAATGNYCFFNLLTGLLCLLLLDDGVLRRIPRLGKIFGEGFPGVAAGGVSKRGREYARLLAAVFYICAGGLVMSQRLFWRHESRGFARVFMGWIGPFRIVNSYGLFAVMTRPRLEIIVEGSNDLGKWLTYEFKWKPGDVNRRPGFVAPHQPRLDWQMWFAALSSYNQNPWFLNFLGRVLQGSPPVLGLLEKNPFPDKPPIFIRATVYEYHFTDFPTKAEQGAWWRREEKKLYCPVGSLRRNQI